MPFVRQTDFYYQGGPWEHGDQEVAKVDHGYKHVVYIRESALPKHWREAREVLAMRDWRQHPVFGALPGVITLVIIMTLARCLSGDSIWLFVGLTGLLLLGGGERLSKFADAQLSRYVETVEVAIVGE